MRVAKITSNGLYGRTDVPARGHVTHTEQGNNRITPQRRHIPAQALVEWDDGSITWERLRDLFITGERKRYEQMPPEYQGATT